MPWTVIGHSGVIERFERAVASNRLASTFLFVGPHGVGKATFARNLAQALLCEGRSEDDLAPCLSCEACVQVAAGSHPDLVMIAKPEEKTEIPLDALIGDRDHRMRSGLCHQVSLKPFRGGRKVAIIDDADYLNQEGANCLLKTLEEPPPKSVIILICGSEQKQLPTIRSRCQIVRFSELSASEVAQVLLQTGLADSEAAAESQAQLCQGSVSSAQLLVDQEWGHLRQSVLRQLANTSWNPQKLGQEILEYVEAGGKTLAQKQPRLRQTLDLAVDLYRQALRDEPSLADRDLGTAVASVQQSMPPLEQLCDCIDCSLEAMEALKRNANLPTLIDCWLDQLARLSRLPAAYTPIQSG